MQTEAPETTAGADKLGCLLDKRLRIPKRMALIYWEREGQPGVCVRSVNFQYEEGWGMTKADALRSLQETLAGLYWWLKENRGLNDGIRAKWNHCSVWIMEKQKKPPALSLSMS